MADQLPVEQSIQKWYTRPQFLVPAAGVGYLLLNKKTRKPALTAGGAILTIMGLTSMREGSDSLSTGFGRIFMAAGVGLLWLGLRKK